MGPRLGRAAIALRTAPPALSRAIALLLATGIVTQILLLYALRYDLRVTFARIGAGELALLLSPLLLSLAGAAAARWAHRRGSGWAPWLVGVPLAIFALVLALSLWLTLDPPVLQHR